MANTKIPSELVAINAISGTLIADNAITSVHIAENNITATQIAINAVTALQMADGTITSAKIADGTIVTADIADSQITTAKIADGTITTDDLAGGIIISSKIANNAILTQHIDDNQITADQIADNAVGLGQMAGLTRGSIIYGDSAGDPAYLAAGTSGHVLTSDGTDISWAADTDLFLASSGGTMTGNLALTKEDPNITLTDSSASRTLAVFVDNNNSVLRSSGQLLLQIGSASAITIDSTKRVGVNQVPTASNFALQVQGIQTDGSDGRAAYFKGYGTHTSIGSTGPTVVVQNANTTTNNYAKLSFESGNAGETVSINAQNIDHSNHYGDMAFNTRGSGGYSEKMRITSNGNIGIKTTAPNAQLHIGDSAAEGSSANPALQIGGAGTYRLGLYTDAEGGIIQNLNGDNGLQFRVKTTGETMRLDTAGNLLLGTTSGTAIQLHATGSRANGLAAQLSNTHASTGSGIVVKGGNNSSTYSADFRDYNNTTLMRIRGDGKVGIGTTAPAYKLDVQDTNDPAQIRLKEDGNTNGFIFKNYNGNEAQLVNVDNGPMVFKTNDTERMRIDASGNLGLGASSPSQKLHVAGGGGSMILNESTSWSYLRLKSPNANGGYIQFADADDDDVGQIFYYHGSGGDYMSFTTNAAERMRITSNGNVGINSTSPQTQFVVQHTDGGSGIEFSMGSSLNYIQSYSRSASDYIALKIDGEDIRFGTNNGTERMRIDNNGRVLIGTTSTTPGFANTSGHAFHTGDASHISRDQGTALVVNRGTNDGDIISLRRAGAEIGKIEATEGPSGSRGLRVTSAATLELKTQKQQWYDSVTLSGTAGATVGLGQFTNNGRGWWVRVTANAHYSNHVSSQVWEFTQNGYVGENHNKWLQVPETISSSYVHNENNIALDVYRDNVAGSTSTPIHIRFRQKSNAPANGSVYYTIETLNGIGFSLDGKGVAGSVSDTWSNTSSANMDGAVGGYYPTRSKYEFPVSDGAFWTDNAVINTDNAKGLYISNRGTVGIGFDKHMHTTSNVAMAGSFDHGGTLHLAGNDSVFVQTSTYGSNSEFMHYVYNDYYKIFRNTGGSNQTALHINSSLVVAGDFNDTSDRNLKKNIVDLPDGSLAIVSQLKPVTFDWKNTDKGSNTGFIAQDVKTVLPNDVSGTEYKESSDLHETNDGLSINSTGIVAHLVKAVQELEKRVKELEG